MLLVLLSVQVAQVLVKVPPLPPQNVHVDKWQLTWSAAPEEADRMYSVQYRSFKGFNDKDEWDDVPACMHTSSHTCDVAFTKTLAKFGCVMLRVTAERHGLTSEPVQACSLHGDSCTPEIWLTTGPGSLTAHLTRSHSLHDEYAGVAYHRISFRTHGDLKQVDAASSHTIEGLERGQEYCVQVQYVVNNRMMGLPTCSRCVVIPEPDTEPAVKIAVAVFLPCLAIMVISVTAYFLIFHRKTIKKCLKPPAEIPDMVLKAIPPQHSMKLLKVPSDEHCDVISSITPGT